MSRTYRPIRQPSEVRFKEEPRPTRRRRRHDAKRQLWQLLHVLDPYLDMFIDDDLIDLEEEYGASVVDTLGLRITASGRVIWPEDYQDRLRIVRNDANHHPVVQEG